MNVVRNILIGFFTALIGAGIMIFSGLAFFGVVEFHPTQFEIKAWYYIVSFTVGLIVMILPPSKLEEEITEAGKKAVKKYL